MAGSWLVPIEYVFTLISAFVAIIVLLWLGVVVRLFVNVERRLLALEEYKANEENRTKLIMSQIRELLLEQRLQISKDLESKRVSIEGTIKQQVGDVVEAIKNGTT